MPEPSESGQLLLGDRLCNQNRQVRSRMKVIIHYANWPEGCTSNWPETVPPDETTSATRIQLSQTWPNQFKLNKSINLIGLQLNDTSPQIVSILCHFNPLGD